jgi:hypothetical protein
MAQPDGRLKTPVTLDDDALARVKEGADRDLAALAHAMQRYASTYLAHRVGELGEEPDPSLVGCDTHSAAVARSIVEQALNAEVLHGGEHLGEEA